METKATYSTAEVAQTAGVHKDTVLRWLRAGLVREPARDRRGWRVFTEDDLHDVVTYAREMPSANSNQFSADPEANSFGVNALQRIDWNFDGAKTNYLTHGIHPYPAKFIPQIPNALIQELSSVGDTVGDVFCGSGTTLVEAQLLKRNAVGVDANPLATLISRAKLARLSEGDFSELRALSDWAIELSAALADPTANLFDQGMLSREVDIPDDDKIPFWFPDHVVAELGSIMFRIKALDSHLAGIVARTAFSSIVVSVSRQDSDTRYVRREKNILPGETVARFSRALVRTLNSLQEYLDATEERFTAQIIEANVLDCPEIKTLDLMVCSPPYPNAYSYHLYHRSRMIWMGMDHPRFKAAEIGSHRKYSSKGRSGATIEVFSSEMASLLHWLRDYLSPRAFVCFVVGDSTIRGRVYDNAGLISEIAERTGYRRVACCSRTLQATKKSFNPRIGKIRDEKILVLRKV